MRIRNNIGGQEYIMKDNIGNESKVRIVKNDREEYKSASDIKDIFDRLFKKCLTLSARAVINMINGLYNTDYPLDSIVSYNWTEFLDDKMKKVLADTIITINGQYSYHLEAQMSNDRTIVFRVFEYGFSHAYRTREVAEGSCRLRFPKPVVIYLYYEGKVPDEYTLLLEFDEGKDIYEYKVPVIKLPDISVEEINDRKMVILIPFHLLKLRYWIHNKHMTKSSEELKKLIECDIIGSIEKNHELGNITTADEQKLKHYTLLLCEYLYRNTDSDGLEVLRDMTDHSLMTEVDILCEEYEQKIDGLQKENDGLQKELADYKVRLAKYEKV